MLKNKSIFSNYHVDLEIVINNIDDTMKKS